ncbi:hypothetical protein GIB67_041585, partial [Kingdonia uniflora]
GDLDEGFVCYVSQLEYRLSLRLSNLAKGILNIIGVCPAQLNRNTWEVINVCESLNRLWEENEVEKAISPKDVLQFHGRMWNDYIIWVKGDYLQRQDEEPMKLLYRTVKKSPQSKVTKKESLLDTVAREEVELEVVLKEFCIYRYNRANSMSEKKATELDFADVWKATTSSKFTLKFPKKKAGKRDSTSRTTGSGKVEGDAKKRRVDPPTKFIGAKVVESRPFEEDELQAVEDRVILAARKGVKEMSASAQLGLSKMGIYLGIEEGKPKLKNGKVELQKNVARLKSDLVLEGKRLNFVKVAQEVHISKLTEEAQKNLDEVVVQRDRLGRQVAKAEVKAIMEGTYVEEDEVEEDLPGTVGGLDVEQLSAVLPAKDIDFQMVQRRCDKLNARVSQLMVNLATTNLRNKKSEAGKRLMKNKGDVGVSIVKGDVADLSARIKVFEGDVAHIQFYVQRGNKRFKENQGKLDIAYSRERELERVIRGKDQFIRKIYEWLKKSLAGGSISKDRELEELCTQVAELRTTNQAESNKAVKKVKEHNDIVSRIDKHMEWQDGRYKKLENCYQRLRECFSKEVMPKVTRSQMLMAVIAYFVEEVKKLEFERDTLHDCLLGRGCICRADVD